MGMVNRRQTVALLDIQTQAKEEQQQQQQQRDKKVAEIAKAFKLSSHQLASKAITTSISSSGTKKFGQLPNLAMQVKFPSDVPPPQNKNKLTTSSSHSKSRSKIADKGIRSLVQQQQQLEEPPPSLGAALLVSKPNASIRRSRSSISSHSTATTLNMSHSTMNQSLSSTMHSLRSTSTTSSTSTGNSFASETSNSNEARKRLMVKAQRVKALRDSFRNSTTAQEKSQHQQRRSVSEHLGGSLMESL
jgi:hypothetical protein